MVCVCVCLCQKEEAKTCFCVEIFLRMTVKILSVLLVYFKI